MQQKVFQKPKTGNGQCIIIEDSDEVDLAILTENISWILKFPIEMISKLSIMNRNRIAQDKIINQIKRKYLGIFIYKKGW